MSGFARIKDNLVERLFSRSDPSRQEQDQLLGTERENGKNEERCYEEKVRHQSDPRQQLCQIVGYSEPSRFGFMINKKMRTATEQRPLPSQSAAMKCPCPTFQTSLTTYY